jgi:glycosyltransferase involved in cell wall biosynthesis
MTGGARVLVDARPLQSADAVRGIGSYVRGLLAGLLEVGFDSRTALLVDAALPPPELPRSEFVAYGVRRRYRGRLALVEEAVTLGGKLERIRPALYHATTLALPGRAPVPVAATLHDLIPWAWGGPAMRGERLRWRLGRRLLRRADLVLAVSEATAADARRIAGVSAERLLVVPEGLAPGFRPAEGARERVRARHGLERPYLLYVGSLDARKEPRSLLRAWDVARAAGADVDLVLAGAGGPQAPASMAGAVGLGYLEHSDLVDLYAAAACLVFPSRYEGFGLPLLEAMGCGCPAVAYRNSSLPEVAGDAAILVPDGDAEALGRAAAEVVTSPGRAEELRRRGLHRARRFTWRRAAEATIQAWESLLGAGVAPD